MYFVYFVYIVSFYHKILNRVSKTLSSTYVYTCTSLIFRPSESKLATIRYDRISREKENYLL